MNKPELYQKVFEQMDKLYEAHKELNELWLDNSDELEDVLEFSYPYQSCFNELCVDVLDWVVNFNELNKIVQYRENKLLTNKDLETGNENVIGSFDENGDLI